MNLTEGGGYHTLAGLSWIDALESVGILAATIFLTASCIISILLKDSWFPGNWRCRQLQTYPEMII